MKKKSKYPCLHGGGFKKVWLTLKFTFVFIMLGVFAVHGAAHSQDVGQITLEMKGVELREVLLTIERQTSFMFLYNKEDLDKVGKVDVSLTGDKINEILDACLKGTGLTYTIQDDVIVLRPQNPAPRTAQQSDRVRAAGKVVDKNGNPLVGVTVIVKGTNIGAATDANGNFIIFAPRTDKHPVLRFSYVGMTVREATVHDDKPLNIVMEEDSARVGEVVVTGYQTVNRADMVGSYTTLKMDDINNPAFTTVDQMLQGQVAGMIVTRSSSRVGTSPKIKIRGTSTLLGNTDPIWVVDGIIQDEPITLNASSGLVTSDLKEILGNQISWLNPNDIETITVLKDASATAVYGSKAANGVIVITTKRPQGTGRLSVNYSATMSFEPRPNYGRFNFMNSQERILFSDEMYNQGVRYGGAPIQQIYSYEGLREMLNKFEISAEEYIAHKNRLETINTDWFDLLTRNSFSHNHNLSVRGSNDKMYYTASVGFSQQPGQEKGNESRRMTSRLSVGAELTSKISIDAALNFTTGETKTFAGVNPMSYATSTSRTLPAYNEDGSLAFHRVYNGYPFNKDEKNRTLGYNILNERDNSGAKSRSNSFQANLNLSWKLTDWLQYQFSGGYSYSNARNEAYQNEKTHAIANAHRGYDYGTVDADNPYFKAAILPFGGVLFNSSANREGYNIQNKLVAAKTFNDIHRINIMVAAEVRSTTNYEDSNNLWGYVEERGRILVRPTLPSALVPVGTSGSITDWGVFEGLYNGQAKIYEKSDNYFSVFGTAAYSLMNRYVFNFTIRNDASNHFGQNVNRRFDPTYSFGFNWRVMQEPFFENRMKWLNDLNISANYGVQGNSLSSISPELIFTQQGVAPNFNDYYSSIANIPNPNLSWERTKQLNAQLDMRLFNAISFTFDYYWKRSNAIVEQPIPSENGRPDKDINGGIVYNEGVEGTVSFAPVVTKDFGIRISLNSSKNWNRGGKQTLENTTRDQYLTGYTNMIIKEGYPLGGFWSYAFGGLTPETVQPCSKTST